MEFLRMIAQREVIVALAIVGATTATIGSYLVRGRKDPNARAQLVLRIGYAITWASVALFVVAGFLAPH